MESGRRPFPLSLLLVLVLAFPCPGCVGESTWITVRPATSSSEITVYFWRAVGWNKKGDYTKVIADATEALRLQPNQAVYNLRGSAFFDKGEYDIAIADFDDALKLGPPSAIIYHNRGNAYMRKKRLRQGDCRF